MDETSKTVFRNFIDDNLVSYSRAEEMGTQYSFQEALRSLQDNVKPLIDESAKIILAHESKIPYQLQMSVLDIINNINAYVKQIYDYKYDDDVKNQLNQRNGIVSQINKFIESVYSERGDRRNPLLTVYCTLKAIVSDRDSALNEAQLSVFNNMRAEQESLKSQYLAKLDESNSILSQLKDKSASFDNLLNALREESSKKAIQNYSNIFKEQSEKHSIFRFQKKWFFPIKIGNAERWLALSVLLLLLFFYIVPQLPNWYQPLLTKSNGEQVLDIGNIAVKLSILTVLIFSITFSFKQYTVNKHLNVLNKHRENALNTYTLFIESISTEDTSTRHQIIVEVAKAIFDQNRTGYIGGKDSDMNGPSILEVTKLVSGSRT